MGVGAHGTRPHPHLHPHRRHQHHHPTPSARSPAGGRKPLGGGGAFKTKKCGMEPGGRGWRGRRRRRGPGRPLPFQPAQGNFTHTHAPRRGSGKGGEQGRAPRLSSTSLLQKSGLGEGRAGDQGGKQRPVLGSRLLGEYRALPALSPGGRGRTRSRPSAGVAGRENAQSAGKPAPKPPAARPEPAAPPSALPQPRRAESPAALARRLGPPRPHSSSRPRRPETPCSGRSGHLARDPPLWAERTPGPCV